jgi:hypothetical protein
VTTLALIEEEGGEECLHESILQGNIPLLPLHSSLTAIIQISPAAAIDSVFHKCYSDKSPFDK